MRQNTRVKKEIIVIGFAAWNRVGGERITFGDCLLLFIADEIVDAVFRPLITHAAAEGEHVINVVAVLQERREVSNAVARIAARAVSRLVVHAARRNGIGQIEEHLIGIEGFMVSINTPGELPAVERCAVQRQLGAILVGILLGSGEAGDLPFSHRRERIKTQRFIAIIDLPDQFLPPEIGVGILQANQMTLGARDTVRAKAAGGASRAIAGDGAHILVQIQPVIIVTLAFVILRDQL
ncbi:hypothetical protein D3C71_1267320 [compost metagenome]